MITLSEGFAIGLGLAGFVISIITLVYYILRERVIGPIFTAVDPRPKIGSTKGVDKIWEVNIRFTIFNDGDRTGLFVYRPYLVYSLNNQRKEIRDNEYLLKKEMEITTIQPFQPSTKAFSYNIPFEIENAKNVEFWFKGYYYNHKQEKINFDFPIEFPMNWF